MRELVELVASGLVDEPDQIRVTESDEGRETLYELSVAEGDVGKVIGKQGRTARALRALLSSAGAKQRKRFVLDIVE